MVPEQSYCLRALFEGNSTAIRRIQDLNNVQGLSSYPHFIGHVLICLKSILGVLTPVTSRKTLG